MSTPGDVTSSRKRSGRGGSASSVQQPNVGKRRKSTKEEKKRKKKYGNWKTKGPWRGGGGRSAAADAAAPTDQGAGDKAAAAASNTNSTGGGGGSRNFDLRKGDRGFVATCPVDKEYLCRGDTITLLEEAIGRWYPQLSRFCGGGDGPNEAAEAREGEGEGEERDSSGGGGAEAETKRAEEGAGAGGEGVDSMLEKELELLRQQQMPPKKRGRGSFMVDWSKVALAPVKTGIKGMIFIKLGEPAAIVDPVFIVTKIAEYLQPAQPILKPVAKDLAVSKGNCAPQLPPKVLSPTTETSPSPVEEKPFLLFAPVKPKQTGTPPVIAEKMVEPPNKPSETTDIKSACQETPDTKPICNENLTTTPSSTPTSASATTIPLLTSSKDQGLELTVPRFLQRLIPVDFTCRVDAEEISASVSALCEKVFKNCAPGTTYKLICACRHNSSITTQLVSRIFAKVMPPHVVDITYSRNSAHHQPKVQTPTETHTTIPTNSPPIVPTSTSTSPAVPLTPQGSNPTTTSATIPITSTPPTTTTTSTESLQTPALEPAPQESHDTAAPKAPADTTMTTTTSKSAAPEPDYYILFEVYHKVCGLSAVKDYARHKRFNLHAISNGS
ncbi:hypothetical protein Pelo_11051 [Pelomyxa schiedti]|nr:hypothetical protein Pelo_11051 [Pelomyxa schiedti]